MSSSRQRRGAARFALLAALLGLAAAPAGADWLVTRDGTWIETRGAWQVKGKVVVFHTLAGALSSLRLSEVDLEKSQRITAQAELARRVAAAARRKPPEKKPPVLVLTDDMVRHVEPANPIAGDAVQISPTLTVSSWERAVNRGAGGVVITGTLRNGSGVDVTGITMSVQLLDAEGKAVAISQAVLTATALAAGEQSGFRVEFPGAFSYTDVRFEPRASAKRPAPPPAEGGAGLTATPAAPSGPLAVSSWRRVDHPVGEGIEIRGTLHNNTDKLMVNVAVEVQLYNEVGDRVGTAVGVLPSTALQPRATADFRASFPRVFAFSEVRFGLKGLPLDVGPPAADQQPAETPRP